MQTPIVNISEDQNIATHESGLISTFVGVGLVGCKDCDYRGQFNDVFKKCTLPCCYEERKDGRSGHFKIMRK